MRGLTIIVVVLTTLYSAYWFAARAAVTQGTAALIDTLRAEGWDVDYATLSTAGYPNRIDTTATDLRLADPSGLGWAAPLFQVFALSYRPNEVIAVWPPEQVLTLADQSLTVTTDGLRASARVGVSTRLPLDQVTAESGALGIVSDNGWTLSLDRALLAFRQAGSDPTAYEAFAEAAMLALPEPLLAALDPEGRQPLTVSRLRLDAGLIFDRPLDRFAGEGEAGGSAALTALTLRDANIDWGDITLSARGALTIDAAGVPEGRITLTATNWRALLELAAAAGAVTPEVAPTWAAMGETMSGGSESLDLPVTFADGMMSVGFIPLGPAPRLR